MQILGKIAGKIANKIAGKVGLFLGLAFVYVAGTSYTQLGGAFSRTGVATYVDQNGLVQTAATGVLREWCHYINGVATTLMEGARTNSVLWNRDLTNVAWTKTSCTAAKDQTGADGAANSASSLVASAANATCLQVITQAVNTVTQSTYVKRITGTGGIQMTTDGGTTWTTITVTAAWARVSIPAQSATNPSVGFRIVTSGDKIAVDYVQNEVGGFMSSPIATTTTATIRNADTLSFSWPYIPMMATLYVKGVELGTVQTANAGMFRVDDALSSAVRWQCDSGGTAHYRALQTNGTTSSLSTAAAAPAINDTLELRVVLNSDGSTALGQAINGGAEVVAAAGVASTLAAAWPAPTNLYLGNQSGTLQGFFAFQACKVVFGNSDLATFR